MKKVLIKTYGCQMNERDSEAVAYAMRHHGYGLTQNEDEADVILLNTCSVRDRAERKALGKMRLLARLKKKKPHLVLGFLGCMAQSRGRELLEEVPSVDLVVGTQKYHRVADYVSRLLDGQNGVGEQAGSTENPVISPAASDSVDGTGQSLSSLSGRPRIVDVAGEQGSESPICEHVLEEGQVTAFVSVMQGCDMFCTFCIVPHTRGRERSRPIPEIVEEVRKLVERGVKEVTLLGQIVNRYGQREFPKRDGKSPFVQLLEALDEIDGLERVRYTSPHPAFFHADLIRAHGQLQKLCEYVHLPVQSGSDRVLRAMHRAHTVEQYCRVVEKLRAVRPEMAISTDIIVGFPGETLEEFQQTVDLVKRVQFNNAFIFKYSERRKTPAAELSGKVSYEEKLRRNHVLLELMKEISMRHHQAQIGRVVEVLVEGQSERHGSRWFGRTRGNTLVFFEAAGCWRGRLAPVRITRATAHALYGYPVLTGR